MDSDALNSQVEAAERQWLDLWIRGPQRLTAPSPPSVGDKAPIFTLQDSRGNPVTLSDLWQDRPLLLLFWRQYGCGCGMERARRLREELPGYREAGAMVAVIGQGEPERAAAYAERHGLDCPVLCDPGEDAYEAYGLVEGIVAQILFDAPEEFWEHTREVGQSFQAERREQGRPPVDNPWLLPGEFVIDPEGTIRLGYRWQYCEDFPNPLVHLTAIRQTA